MTGLLSIRLRKVLYGLPPHRWRQVFVDRLAASIEHTHLGSLEVDYVIDVGANRGQFVLLAQSLWPDAPILAFEPLEHAADVFDRYASSGKVELVRAAVSSDVGARAMHISGRDDSSSLLVIGPKQAQSFPGTAMTGVTQVPVTTLARHLSPTTIGLNSLMKVDVQGSELEVLKGAGSVLELVKYVYVELSFAELYVDQPLAGEVVQFMFDSEFSLNHVANISAPHGDPVQADFLFENLRLI